MNKSLKAIAYLSASIGLVDSIYLTWIKLANQEAYCAGIGDCEVVNTSRYSEIGGIPIALFGIGAYLAILIVLFLQDQDNVIGNNSGLILFAITLTGVLYSAYLTYIEIAVIYAICPFCVVSAIVMLVLFVVTLVHMYGDGSRPPFAEE